MNATITLELTVHDLVSQGYSKTHAEAYIAMIAQRQIRAELAAAGELPQPNFYPADGPRYAEPQPAASGGKPARTRRPSSRPALPPVDEASPAVVRAWAAEAGVECNAKGRVPRSVLAQYERARQAGARV